MATPASKQPVVQHPRDEFTDERYPRLPRSLPWSGQRSGVETVRLIHRHLHGEQAAGAKQRFGSGSFRPMR